MNFEYGPLRLLLGLLLGSLLGLVGLLLEMQKQKNRTLNSRK